MNIHNSQQKRAATGALRSTRRTVRFAESWLNATGHYVAVDDASVSRNIVTKVAALKSVTNSALFITAGESGRGKTVAATWSKGRRVQLAPRQTARAPRADHRRRYRHRGGNGDPGSLPSQYRLHLADNGDDRKKMADYVWAFSDALKNTTDASAGTFCATCSGTPDVPRH